MDRWVVMVTNKNSIVSLASTLTIFAVQKQQQIRKCSCKYSPYNTWISEKNIDFICVIDEGRTAVISGEIDL